MGSFYNFLITAYLLSGAGTGLASLFLPSLLQQALALSPEQVFAQPALAPSAFDEHGAFVAQGAFASLLLTAGAALSVDVLTTFSVEVLVVGAF